MYTSWMDQNNQLIEFINQGRNRGLSEDAIKNQLLKAGWQQPSVDAALNYATTNNNLMSTVQVSHQSIKPHRVRNGVLWILSPFIVFISVALLQFVFRLTGLNSPIINILSLLAGMAGLILIPVGPIVGIITLAKR
jgi:hypothetical protein